MMRLRSDFSATEQVRFEDVPWVASPQPGVERKLLERIGDEVARATSFVRYAAGHRFPAHEHELGEEFLVLEGVFQDEHGDFPAGSYVRNPPGSRHQPFSDGGCLIFVKLRQFALDDTSVVRSALDGVRYQELGDGAQAASLHRCGAERVDVVRLAGAEVVPTGNGGFELLTLDDGVTLDGRAVPRWTWHRTRTPPRLAGAAGTRVWLKRGHLAAVAV